MKKTESKILFIFRGMGSGGAQKVLAFVSNTCVDAGYDVSIISLLDIKPTLKINDNIKVSYIGYDGSEVNKNNVVKQFFYKLQLIIKLRSLIKKSNPDLIITFMSDIVRIVVLSTMGLNMKIIGSERGNPLKYTKRQLAKYSRAYRKCSAVVFQTYKAASIFDKIILDKSFIIPNPCIPRVNPIEPYKGKRKKIFLAAGRLCVQKRFDILIFAFLQLTKKHSDYKLYIYGEGPEREYLQKIINENNLNEVVFLKGDTIDVFKEAREFTAFVLTSDYEGIPNVLIEALSIGLPCISTDCEPGGPRLLLDEGRRGILVPTGDVNKLTAAMIDYIENPNLARRYGNLGVQVKKELAPNLIAKKWLNIIEKTLQ